MKTWNAGAVGIVCALLVGCTGEFVVDDRGVVVAPDPVIIDPSVRVVEPAPIHDPAPRRRHRHSARGIYDIPPGHYPPPGECRVWFPDRPAGQQPPPGSCNVRVPRGAVLIEG
ncbi:MAG: hypothetical protein AAFQ84_12135 [Pseudomonadota bacterium]